MRALLTTVLAAVIGLMISGCAGQKMMEPMDSEVSSMDTPMEKSMKTEAMTENAAAETMQPEMEAMDKATQ